MNKQTGEKSILWTRVWGRDGFTANPGRGCGRGCRWHMPDGDVAICYAETMANRIVKMNGGEGHYSQGFSHYYFDDNELNAINSRKKPAGIFVGSMADMYDHVVPAVDISRTLEVMQNNPQHIFFTLTKHATRLTQFAQPYNNWVGISTPPDEMYGAVVSDLQKTKWLDVALDKLSQVNVPIRWLSIEPLSATGLWGDDLVNLLTEYAGAYEWVVIGAATHKGTAYMPDPEILARVVDAVDNAGASIWFKSNLDPDFVTGAVGHYFQNHPTPYDVQCRVEQLEQMGIDQ